MTATNSPDNQTATPSPAAHKPDLGEGVMGRLEKQMSNNTMDDASNRMVIDPIAERKLVWKFDLRLLPTLAIMYLFAGLDKGNIGNAKTAGLEEDLNLTGNQYNLLLTIFFIPFVLTAPFLGIAGKKYGPSRVLPLMMVTFGSMTLLTTAAKNFSGLMALRWFLGMGESAFFPLVIYYQTTFYRRGELARRLAIFYSASSMANAFGGLLSWAVFRINTGALASWRYLFVIEGSLTLLFAIFAYWYLPYNAQSAKFLTPEEKNLAFHRIQVDASSIVDEKFNLKESFGIFKHPTTWVILAIEMCLGMPIPTVALYLPVIVQRLGFGTIKTNLYVVAPNISGAVILIIMAFASDYTKVRSPFVALGFLLTMAGFVIYATIDVENQLQLAYFACFMMAWGTSAPSVLLDTWFSNNIANENKRVMLTSIAVPLANSMGLVSSNIFRAQDAPKYIPALITTAVFGATGCVLTCLLALWMWVDNKRRDRAAGKTVHARDVPTKFLADGPSNPEYRWVL